MPSLLEFSSSVVGPAEREGGDSAFVLGTSSVHATAGRKFAVTTVRPPRVGADEAT